MIKLLIFLFITFGAGPQWSKVSTEVIATYKESSIGGYAIKGYSDTLYIQEDIWIKQSDTIRIISYNYPSLDKTDTLALRYGVMLGNQTKVPKKIVKYYKMRTDYVWINSSNFIRLFHKKLLIRVS